MNKKVLDQCCEATFSTSGIPRHFQQHNMQELVVHTEKILNNENPILDRYFGNQFEKETPPTFSTKKAA